MSHGADVVMKLSSSCCAASAFAASVRTITYRTPRSMRCRTPTVGVVVHVAELAHGIRRALGHRGRRQEVVRRRSGRFEEQAFHRRDAAVGPERQQHQGHRRAVLTVLGVVLPQRPTAALRVADGLHRRDHVVVLGIERACLVAAPVVPRPAVRDRSSAVERLVDRPPCVDLLRRRRGPSPRTAASRT